MRVQVIGVGSDRGDDAAGLQVVARLALRGMPNDTRAIACPRPFPDLLDQLAHAPHVILVDAVRSGGRPGSLCWLSREALARQSATSSHGLGVARVLDLADALSNAPSSIEILGIEIGDALCEGDAPTTAVAQSVERACALVRQRMTQLLSADEAGARTPGGVDARGAADA
jgi:hydrogenase maturation protease